MINIFGRSCVLIRGYRTYCIFGRCRASGYYTIKINYNFIVIIIWSRITNGRSIPCHCRISFTVNECHIDRTYSTELENVVISTVLTSFIVVLKDNIKFWWNRLIYSTKRIIIIQFYVIIQSYRAIERIIAYGFKVQARVSSAGRRLRITRSQDLPSKIEIIVRRGRRNIPTQELDTHVICHSILFAAAKCDSLTERNALYKSYGDFPLSCNWIKNRVVYRSQCTVA